MARNFKPEYINKLRKINQNGYTFDISNYLYNPAFGNGGRPNGETKIIPWDEPEARNEYVINAYTFVWDERINKSFNEYIGR